MKKKFLYILILIALVGVFAPMVQMHAAEEIPEYFCIDPKGESSVRVGGGEVTQERCEKPISQGGLGWKWVKNEDGKTQKEKQHEECLKRGDMTSEHCKAWAGIPTKSPTPGPLEYKLLAPLPCESGTPGCVCENDKCELKSFDPGTMAGDNTALGRYLNLMIKIFIGLCAVFAVVMIVIGGMEYMTSELAHSKEAGKERIWQAILGLLIALGAYALLNTINPKLLETDLKSLKSIIITVTDEDFIVPGEGGGITSGTGGAIKTSSIGTSCDFRSIKTAADKAAADDADKSITEKEAATFSCLITPESGCKSVQNYKWGSGSSAYGPYQITLQSHSECFDTPVCSAAVGISGPLNCSRGFKNGNPKPGFEDVVEMCRKAADNFTCSTGAAVCVLRKQGFSAWTKDSHSSKQQKCLSKYGY